MLREIVRPTERQLSINIPQEYVNKKIEILVLPFFEMEQEERADAQNPDDVLMRLFENAPNVKVDRNVDIDALMNEVNDVVL